MGSPPLRRNREFVALWTGQAVSALGASASALAYPLLILVTTGSPGLAGLVSAVLAATTFLVRLPAGVLADRVDRRILMLWCDAGRFVAVGSVAVAVLVGRVALSHILLVAVVEGTLGALFAPAEAVAVRRVVAPEQVRDAVAANESRRQLAALLGPTVGGVLFGAGRALPFVADALSYVVSFCAVCTLRTPLRTEPRLGAASARNSVTGCAGCGATGSCAAPRCGCRRPGRCSPRWASSRWYWLASTVRRPRSWA